MTAQSFTNTATDDTHVGVQAGILKDSVVHIDYRYEISPDATPEEKFRAGVAYLQARMPAEAQRHIEDAVALGYRSDEVHFHRLLALLSGRPLRQLSTDEYHRLDAIAAAISPPHGDGEWTAGLRSLLVLLAHLHNPDRDLIDKELSSLPLYQRDLIADHLGVLLEGPVQDDMWWRSVDRAERVRSAGDREQRVWIFFQQKPEPPQRRAVAKKRSLLPDAVVLAGAATAFLYAVGSIGWSLLTNPAVEAILAYVIAVVGLALFLRFGAEWHFRHHRARTKDAELSATRRRRSEAPAGGFARKVDRMFENYFARYVPQGADRSEWLRQTSGIRAALRDEVVETYRAQRIKADRIAWLIRHLVGDVRTRWERGDLTAYRDELRTPLSARAGCLGGLLMVCAACYWIVPAIVATAPLSGVAWTLLAVPSGLAVTWSFFRMENERRRVAADIQEREIRYRSDRKAYDRWRLKLEARPSDTEMAEWLECDRKILVAEALRHYGLKMSQVIAHAFIEAPAKSYQRARVLHGPWRYSRYRMLLFLLTSDGVRQVEFVLDFTDGTFRRTQRLNYRFDAVAAVRVHGSPTERQTFQLTLVNGKPIDVPVTEDVAEDIQPGESIRNLSDVALDASGLPRTLNVLEGIAAEGKEWIKHQRHLADDRLGRLAARIKDVVA